MTKTARKSRAGSKTKREPRKNMLEHVKNGRANTKFVKGNAGRPKGAKDRIPNGRVVKASIKAIAEEVASNEGTTVRKAIIDGIKGGPRFAHNYLRFVAEYVDGKPADTLNVGHSFNEDELAQAKDRLDRKMTALATAILSKRKATGEEPET